jgi:hypothetical protein
MFKYIHDGYQQQAPVNNNTAQELQYQADEKYHFQFNRGREN